MGITLRDIKFQGAIGASGVQGFFSGREYFHHGVFKIIPGFSFDGMTFVAKTMTFYSKKGNAALKKDGVTFASMKPDCIKAYLKKGIALNAVGLSNIGAEELLAKNIWQQMTKPFMLSFMVVGQTKEERIREITRFTELLAVYLPYFKAPIALQINFSCPNTNHGQSELMHEIIPFLDIASELNIPLVPKVSILLSHAMAARISEHPACDALCVSNTIPFGELPEKIPWDKYFGSDSKEESPLARYGGGGLSGKILFPLLCDWLRTADRSGIKKPIIAGGGIMNPGDVLCLSNYYSVKAVSPGSVAFLRPWMLAPIIKNANRIFHR